jgi:hypothetical protein
MIDDPGADEVKKLLETPSTSLEAAIQSLGANLEAAHAAQTGGIRLPESTRTPINQLHAYYRELFRRISGCETNNPARKEAMKACKRMEEGLDNLATAIGLEGEEAKQETELGAIEMERAGTELAHALQRLG